MTGTHCKHGEPVGFWCANCCTCTARPRFAADLPVGSVVAEAGGVLFKEDSQSLSWSATHFGGRVSDSFVDLRIAAGAQVLRVGEDT